MRPATLFPCRRENVSFAAQAFVDEKLESPDIGPVIVAAELSIGVRNVFSGRDIGDI